jgi:hypothetical protein
MIDDVLFCGVIPLNAVVLWLVPSALWSILIYAGFELARYITSRWRPSSGIADIKSRTKPNMLSRGTVGILIATVGVLVVTSALLSTVEYKFDNPCKLKCLDLRRDPVPIVGSGDNGIREFVKSIRGIVSKAILMGDVSCTERGYSMLASIEGLEAIDLAAGGDRDPIVALGRGEFRFRNVLSDAKFAEIIKIPSLKTIWIWYGSLSSSQKKLLHERLPACCLHENLNNI